MGEAVVALKTALFGIPLLTVTGDVDHMSGGPRLLVGLAEALAALEGRGSDV